MMQYIIPLVQAWLPIWEYYLVDYLCFAFILISVSLLMSFCRWR